MISLLLAFLISPAQLVAWVEDDDQGTGKALGAGIAAAALASVFTIRSAAANVPSGMKFGAIGAVAIVVFMIVTMIVSIYVCAAIYLVTAKVFKSTWASFGQGVRLAGAIFWLSTVVSLPGVMLYEQQPIVGAALLALGSVYALWVNARGLIDGMGAHPLPVRIFGMVLALLTVFALIGLPVLQLSAQERAAEERLARQQQETERLEQERLARQKSRQAALERKEAERAEWEEQLARARAEREKAEQGDYLEVQINSLPPNAEVSLKDASETLGKTPFKARLPRQSFPVTLKLKGANGKEVEYEVSSLQATVTVLIPE